MCNLLRVLTLVVAPCAAQMGQMKGRSSNDGKKNSPFDEATQGKPAGEAQPVCPDGQFEAPKLLAAMGGNAIAANGCGPQGMQVAESFGLWRCCNRHDVCFSACGIEFKYCEDMYSKCMKKRCKAKENKGQENECNQQAQSFSGMTGMFGAGSFQSSMQGVCDCVSTKEKQTAAMRRFAEDIYDRFGPEGKKGNQTLIDSLMKKYEKKKGHLVFDLMMQYGASEGFVPFDNVAASFEVEGPSNMPKQQGLPKPGGGGGLQSHLGETQDKAEEDYNPSYEEYDYTPPPEGGEL